MFFIWYHWANSPRFCIDRTKLFVSILLYFFAFIAGKFEIRLFTRSSNSSTTFSIKCEINLEHQSLNVMQVMLLVVYYWQMSFISKSTNFVYISIIKHFIGIHEAIIINWFNFMGFMHFESLKFYLECNFIFCFLYMSYILLFTMFFEKYYKQKFHK